MGAWWWGSEGALLDEIADRLELEDHGECGACVVGVDDEERRKEVGAWLFAEPADDGHAAVVAVRVDEVFASEVMVEMYFFPGFLQSEDAVGGGLDPDRVGVEREELDSPRPGRRPGTGCGSRSTN